MNDKFVILLIISLILLGGCSSEPDLPTATPSPEITTTDSLPPTRTPYPTSTTRPTRIPRDTPTLPPLSELACIPDDAERVSAIVIGIMDGDTIRVSIRSLTYTVRYIGIDTPETSTNPVEYYGPEASQRNRELVDGQRVTLIRDPNNDDTDRYGRLLRYVIVDDVFVNYLLVQEGYAFLFFSGHSCGEEFFQAYLEAQEQEVGIFAP